MMEVFLVLFQSDMIFLDFSLLIRVIVFRKGNKIGFVVKVTPVVNEGDVKVRCSSSSSSSPPPPPPPP